MSKYLPFELEDPAEKKKQEYKNCKICLFHRQLLTRSEGEPGYNTLDKSAEPQHKCMALGIMIDGGCVGKFNREGHLPVGRRHRYDMVAVFKPTQGKQDVREFWDVLDGNLVKRATYRNDDKAPDLRWNIYEDMESSPVMSLRTMVGMTLREYGEHCELFVNKQKASKCEEDCGECIAWKTCTHSRVRALDKAEFRAKVLEALLN